MDDCEMMAVVDGIQTEGISIFCGSGVIRTFAMHSPKLMEQSIQQTKEQQ